MILSPTVVNMHEYISDIELRRQAWKYYAVPIFWIVYTFFLPWAWTRFGPWSILLMVIPGAGSTLGFRISCMSRGIDMFPTSITTAS